MHGKEMGVIECWYTKADKLPETKNKRSRVTKSEKHIIISLSTIILTEVGFILTALDLHSPWPCLDEEVSHQLFQRVPWEKGGEDGKRGRLSCCHTSP